MPDLRFKCEYPFRKNQYFAFIQSKKIVLKMHNAYLTAFASGYVC